MKTARNGSAALVTFIAILFALLIAAGAYYAYYLANQKTPQFTGVPIGAPVPPTTPSSTPPSPGPSSTPPIPAGWMSDANVTASVNSGHDVQAQTGIAGFYSAAYSHITALTALHPGWVRMDITWTKVEQSKGVYDFSSYDPIIQQLNQGGIKVLAILAYSNPLYSGTSTPSYVPPDDSGFQNFKQGFGAYASAVAAHFKGKIAAYEIWNEPFNNFWSPQPNAAQYAVFENYAVQQVRAADPAAEITTAALVGGGISSTTSYMYQFLADGGGVGVDAVAMHPYRSTVPESVIADYAAYAALAHQYLPTAALWNTEWGYVSNPGYYKILGANGEDGAVLQAKLAVREMLSTWVAGFQRSIYFCLQDVPQGNPKGLDWGLYSTDWTPKPAASAMAALLGHAQGQIYEGTINSGNSHVHIAKLDNASQKTLIFWSDDPSVAKQVTFTVTSASASNYMGAALPAGKTFAIGDAPSYFTFGNPSAAVGFTF